MGAAGQMIRQWPATAMTRSRTPGRNLLIFFRHFLRRKVFLSL
jgi:hypothetical protein